jgi:hypothetical protein
VSARPGRRGPHRAITRAPAADQDGIAYNAKKLAADVAGMVEKQKGERAGKATTSQPHD